MKKYKSNREALEHFWNVCDRKRRYPLVFRWFLDRQELTFEQVQKLTDEDWGNLQVWVARREKYERVKDLKAVTVKEIEEGFMQSMERLLEKEQKASDLADRQLK